MAVIRQSLTMLGFGSDQFHCLCRLLVAIIHLGDISFSSADDNHSNTEKVAVSNKEKLNDGEETVLDLWLYALTEKTIAQSWKDLGTLFERTTVEHPQLCHIIIIRQGA